MTVIAEHDRVVLAEALSPYQLEEGDIGTVVYVHGGGIGYEVEFVTLDGALSKVVEVTARQIRSVGVREIPHARSLAEA